MLRSNFMINAVTWNRTNFSDTPHKSSWIWHLDDVPNCYMKIFVYLNDVSEESGATLVHLQEGTEQIIKKGYIDRNILSPEAKKDLDDSNQYSSLEGEKGTVFLAHTGRVIHRANIPVEDKHRDVLVFEVLPAIRERLGYHESLYKAWQNPFRLLLT